MSHEVTFTIEEDRYTDLTRIKERHGRTWKGLTLEGAKTLSSEMSEANGHSQLYETMRLLRADLMLTSSKSVYLALLNH